MSHAPPAPPKASNWQTNTTLKASLSKIPSGRPVHANERPLKCSGAAAPTTESVSSSAGNDGKWPRASHADEKVLPRWLPRCSFCRSAPPQLSQLRGRDRGFTLLHAVVEQIILHEPSLAAFTQELAEFETVPGGVLHLPLNPN